MKIINIIVISLLFITLDLNATSITISGVSGVCCKFTTTGGVSCSIPSSCTYCRCEGGLFSGVCECLDSPTGMRNLPNLTTQEEDDFADLLIYVDTYNTSSMDLLADKIQDIFTAISNSNQSDYDSAETDYFNTFINSLSTNEKNDIITWMQNKGYPGF